MARAIAAVVLMLGVFPQSTPSPGLDHVNIAVVHLEAAAERFRALGFALKPGQPHANGIRNQHAKFPDGTELELITAPEARDALTKTYRQLLANGDGGAFLAFFLPPGLPRPESPPSFVFFGGLNHSPTDRPEHFAHENTASALISVWLAADDLQAERRLLRGFGATFGQRTVLLPKPHLAEVAILPDGDEVVLLPASMRPKKDRIIAGVTVRARSLAAAQQVWSRAKNLPAAPIIDAPGKRAVLPPATALGLWLEFREIGVR